ncbi:MAG: glycoside hydrolase family 5 protein [Lachnospiraceae bacterium]|nr:glycoside hydrolase family 5 protein [Lachnospiraceae bacterium]
MKNCKRFAALSFAAVMVLSACGKNTDPVVEEPQDEQVVDVTDVADTTEPETDQYIELALNVYYNDADHSYYDNEAGQSIIVTEEGQYTVTFDCATDLSEAAVSAGVDSLTNLTAVYILDMGVGQGKQSPLKSCDIMYDSVVVDGTELTVTLDNPKSAFKSSGVFDTNDPVNAWDASYVAEVDIDSKDHVANFNSVESPKTISVTFTLSNMNWGEETAVAEGNVSGDVNTYVNTTKYSDIDFTDINSVDLMKYMGNGINLGNTMEAVVSTYAKDLDTSMYEQAWGQPITTKEMIVGMKNCGFDTLRIPVAWCNMMDYENDDYTINTALLDRVQQIVDWATEAEMFVIVNDHWDGNWWEKFAGTAEEKEQAWKIYESMWTQVGERFKDYPDTLILESANEELGSGWMNKGLTEAETYTLMNEVNQKFVDIIRGIGGNNDDRFLLIAGNNTNVDRTCDKRFVMPKDTVSGKLIVSVHYYDPWNYCGDKSVNKEEDLVGYRWGLQKEYTYATEQLAKMQQFIEDGYGVIIGEYGALCAYINNKSYQIPNAVEYNQNVLDLCDLYGYCPVLWDCNNVYNKRTQNTITPEMLELYTSRCYAEEMAKGDGYLQEVQNRVDTLTAEAPDHWEGQEVYEPGTPVAWIMWNGGAGTYSVGDTFNAADNTAGIKATNVVIEGEGEYTVSLDFAGGNTGLTFAALGIADCEDLYPGAIIRIKSITYDGEEVKLNGQPYTSSDDGHCTRVNLYNGWINTLPDDARTFSGQLTGATPTLLTPNEIVDVKNISITFEFIESK